MEVFTLLLATEHGVAALSTVTLAISMLVGTFSLLAYKANKTAILRDWE